MPRKALLGGVSDNELRLLRVFRAVVDCGGFSAAELELNINRSTISRHIKDLETRLGMTLCRRGRAGFSLTDEGRQVDASARRILAAMSDFQHEVQDLQQQLKGKLSLAIFDKTAGNPACHIDRALRRFDELAPAVHPEVHVEAINTIERGVIEGRFQLGIIPLHRPSSSLDYYPLFAEQMYLYCGRDHPLFHSGEKAYSQSLLEDYKYVGIGYHSPNMEVTRQWQRPRDATAYDQEAVAHLVLSGCYLGYLPAHYARTFVEAGAMRAVCPGQFQYVCQFSAIVRHSPPPSRVLKTLLEALLAVHGAVGHTSNSLS